LSLLPVGEEWAPETKRPVVTYALIIINVAVYIASSANSFFITTSNWWVNQFSLIPILLADPTQAYRIISSMFLHANFLHILFNMYFLYFFGKEVEGVMGSLRYGILYFVAGLAATAFHIGFIPIMGFENLLVPALGASGAISGVLGAYLLLYPRRKLTTCWFMWLLPFCFTMSAAGFLIFWFALQVFYGFGSLGTVAFFAHAGGFVTGLALLKAMGAPYYVREDYYTHPYRFSSYGFGSYYLVHPRRLNFLPSLNRWAKIVLAVLLAILLIGSAYSATYATTSLSGGGPYLYVITANYPNTSETTDLGVYSPTKGLILTPTNDAPRIVMNRLYWAGLLRGPPNKIVNDLRLDETIKSPYNLNLHLRLIGRISYNERGILSYSKGLMITDVIETNPLSGEISLIRNKALYYNIKLVEESSRTSLYLVFPSALISVILTLAALYAVIRVPTESEGYPHMRSSWAI